MTARARITPFRRTSPRTSSRGLHTLRVVHGEPTEEELAALTVAVVALAATPETPDPAARANSRWNDPAARMRRQLHPGPGAWRASAWSR